MQVPITAQINRSKIGCTNNLLLYKWDSGESHLTGIICITTYLTYFLAGVFFFFFFYWCVCVCVCMCVENKNNMQKDYYLI